MADQNKNRPPDRKVSAGKVHASLWATEKTQDGREFTQWSVRIEKRFWDKDGQAWRLSNSYFPNELADLELVAHRAREICRLDKGSEREGGTEEDARECANKLEEDQGS